MPVSTRLQMSAADDRLSLAYNTFFSDLYIPAPSDSELDLRFVISGKGRPADDPKLTLQLCLKSGEMLETGAGQKIRTQRRAESIWNPWAAGFVIAAGRCTSTQRHAWSGPCILSILTRTARKRTSTTRWARCRCRYA